MSSEAGFHRLTELVVGVMHDNQPMTVDQIVKAVRRRAGVKTDRRSVRRALSNPHRFMPVRPRFKFFWRSLRWRLVEAGSADDPGNAGAPVPARPYRPSLSGAAAADLTFREDKPPPDAIGRTA